jgi:hypothetical protein
MRRRLTWVLFLAVTLAPGLDLECRAQELHTSRVKTGSYFVTRTVANPAACFVGARYGDQLDVWTQAPAPGQAILLSVRSVDPVNLARSAWGSDFRVDQAVRNPW